VLQPDIWLLEDTEGTARCAIGGTKLYAGSADRDTHAVINNMRWGERRPDLLATNGHGTSIPKGNASERWQQYDFGGYSAGVIRFKPDGTAFSGARRKEATHGGSR